MLLLVLSPNFLPLSFAHLSVNFFTAKAARLNAKSAIAVIINYLTNMPEFLGPFINS